MNDSILQSIKKLLGLDPDDTSFDVDILMHINTVFNTLAQLGIGPAAGYMIDGASNVWSEILGSDSNLNSIKTLIYLRVRMLFDPPTSAHAISAFNETAQMLEWRLNVYRETAEWVDPEIREAAENRFGDPIVIDGGVG